MFFISGQPNARVERGLSFTSSNAPRGPLYLCQQNAWMDERVMLRWIEVVLKPYIETSPQDVVPIIFLDSYRCHMMGSVVQAIEELGCEVMHIPGGCTCVLQPIDVDFNKPFKSCYRNRLRNWMVQEAIMHGEINCPSREQVAQWIVTASEFLSTQTIHNAWRRTGLECFPKENYPHYSWYFETSDQEDDEDEEIIEISALCCER